MSKFYQLTQTEADELWHCATSIQQILANAANRDGNDTHVANPEPTPEAAPTPEVKTQPLPPVETPILTPTRDLLNVDRVALNVCSRSDSWPYEQDDIDTIRRAGFSKVKFMTSEPVSNYWRVIQETNATADLLRLYFPRADDRVDWSMAQWVAELLPRLEPWFAVKSDWIVEVGNEPNHAGHPVEGGGEGFGTMFRNASHWQLFFVTMADAIRNAYPDAKIAYPGLSPSVREETNTGLHFTKFIEQTPRAVEIADYWCTHSYWQNAEHVGSTVFGASFIEQRTAFYLANGQRAKPIIESEFARTGQEYMTQETAAQYIARWNSLHGNDLGLRDSYIFTLYDHRSNFFQGQHIRGSNVDVILGAR